MKCEWCEKEYETIEQRLEIAERVAEYHVNNCVSSQVLCEVCHKEEHSFLNF